MIVSSNHFSNDLNLALSRVHVDLGISQNIVSWITTRQVIQGFGINYHIRIKLYTTYFIGIIFAILIYAYVVLIGGSNLDIVTIVLFIFDTLWIVVPIFLMVNVLIIF